MLTADGCRIRRDRFLERLRPTLRFDSVPELVAAIDADVERTRDILAAERAAGRA